jgi:hypothetical protein
MASGLYNCVVHCFKFYAIASVAFKDGLFMKRFEYYTHLDYKSSDIKKEIIIQPIMKFIENTDLIL